MKILSVLFALPLLSSQAYAAPARYAFEAHLSPGLPHCGPGQVSGWTEVLDIYYAKGSNTLDATSYFDPSSGVFTAPTDGVYEICSSARVKQNATLDFTIKKNATIIGAFGMSRPMLSSGWQSMSRCVNTQLTQGDQVTLYQNGASSSDCLEETSWKYNHFSGKFLFKHTP